MSSRFDGTVSRIDATGGAQIIASDLGVACGIAFDTDGAMYVGDRSGTIFRIGPSGGTTAFASLPPSVAAFHLAYGVAGGWLYATAPTLASRDAVYRIDRHGRIETMYEGFGRPQGLAVDPRGDLYRRGGAGRIERHLSRAPQCRAGTDRLRPQPDRPGLRSARRIRRHLARDRLSFRFQPRRVDAVGPQFPAGPAAIPLIQSIVWAPPYGPDRGAMSQD